MMGWQWHQLDHMQIICTTITTPVPHQSIFYGPDALPDTHLPDALFIRRAFIKN